MVLKKSILIGAIGQKDTGKSTVLCFLAENFYDNDIPAKCHDCRVQTPAELAKHFEPQAGYKLSNAAMFTTVVAVEPVFDVVLVDNITETDAHIIKSLNGIIIKVVRNEYDNNIGRQSTKHRYPTEEEKWIAEFRSDFPITSFEESLRRLKFETTMLYDLIINSTKFQQCLGPKE
jgi:hypothetical protein